MSPIILERAIESYNEELAIKMIDNARDLNVVHTMSPLETAIRGGQFHIVKYLIQKGADPNYQINTESSESYTALHVAAESMSEDILEYLVDNGGEINVNDSEGRTPFDRAKEVKLSGNMMILENANK